jgi:hypothetical protein
LESAHWPQPCLEPTVVGFDGIVGVPLGADLAGIGEPIVKLVLVAPTECANREQTA